MTPKDLAGRAKASTLIENLVGEVLASESVAACSSNDHYVRFRECVAKAFPSASSSLIAGSGNWGFSMKPHVLGRPFSPHSDVDLVVLDLALFQDIWAELRRYDRESYYQLNQGDRDDLRRKGQNIYCGFASPEWIPGTVSGLRWELRKKLNQLSSFLIGGRQVNAFFFKTIADVVDYYKRGFIILMNNYKS